MAAPATEQETSVFMQLGAAITALTGKIDNMTFDVRLRSQEATTWQLGAYDATWGAQPATNADAVRIVQQSIAEVIAPAVMSLTDKLANRCNLITEEIRAMAIRMAWMEQNVLKFQQDLARTQLVIRNWPDRCTLEDRTATVNALVSQAHLSQAFVKQARPVYWGENDTQTLEPVSIITFYSFADRKAFQASLKDGKFALFYKMKDGAAHVTEKKLKVIPGITAFERRLEAPLQGLTNAYTESYTAYRSVSFRPDWKTLSLYDDRGAWMGRVRYTRARPSSSSHSPSATDWQCEVLIPEENFDTVMDAWCKLWTRQLQKQCETTDAEEKAQEDLTAAQPGTGLPHFSKLLQKSRPAFDHATALTANIQDWQLRYKFEFPWAVTFTAVSPASSHRAMTQNLRSAEDLMSEMATHDANMFELDPQDVRTPDEVHRDNLAAEEIKSIEQPGGIWRTEKGIKKPDGTYTPDVSQWWFAEGKYWIGWGSKERRSKIAKMQAKEEEEEKAEGDREEKRAAEAYTGSQGGGPPDKWWTDKFGHAPQFSQFPGVSRSTASSQSVAGVRGGAASSQLAPAGFTSSGNQPTPGIPPRQPQAPNTTAQTRSRSPSTRKAGPTTVTRGEDL
ncbi:unnamed protein product [Polarella glacialis]|uniref:Uncharacterized protein n=1 Tax=Polarella glacialis TaxID=89957 RepID=A0A813GD76_POLGL|nr:unnamed protein product [Polarella glacialis]